MSQCLGQGLLAGGVFFFGMPFVLFIFFSMFYTLSNTFKTWTNNKVRLWVLEPKEPSTKEENNNGNGSSLMQKLMPLVLVVLVIIIFYLVFFNG